MPTASPRKDSKLTAIAPVSNNGQETIEYSFPYTVAVTIEGSADLMFHRWSNEDVEAKQKAAKGSKAKKTDNVEAYVYRDENGEIALPGEYLRQAIIQAAKFRQDPRSPRKSAMDLFKAGIVSLTNLATLGTKDWDYLDARRVVIQRNDITRIRPCLLKGWKTTVDLQVLLPEYVPPDLLLAVINDAGRLVGVGSFRPTFGRFAVINFALQS